MSIKGHEVARETKRLLPSSDDLCSVPGTHMIEGDNLFLQVVL